MEETTQRQQKSIKDKKLLKDSADVVLDIVIDRIQDTKNDNNNWIALPTPPAPLPLFSNFVQSILSSSKISIIF